MVIKLINPILRLTNNDIHTTINTLNNFGNINTEISVIISFTEVGIVINLAIISPIFILASCFFNLNKILLNIFSLICLINNGIYFTSK